MTRRPTLEDVAARTNVSRQTVSNVLNSPHLVRPETRRRVRAAIDELGYRPSLAARQLVTRRSRVLGFAMPAAREGTRYDLDAAFLRALTEAAQSHGYRIMLFTAAGDEDEIGEYAELLDGADLAGFVLAHTHYGDPRTRWLRERGVPFVTFGRPWGDATASHPWVDVDGAAGTRAAVAHLAERGHRRIAFAGWPRGSGVGDDRRAGWQDGLRGLGVADAEIAAWHVETSDSVEAAREPLRRLFQDVRPTAVVCVSDSVAVASLGVRQELDVDVAVVGFDDAQVAEPLELSSLRQPLTEAAERCIELVLGTTTPERAQLLLAPHLITRSSSEAVPAPLPTSRRQS